MEWKKRDGGGALCCKVSGKDVGGKVVRVMVFLGFPCTGIGRGIWATNLLGKEGEFARSLERVRSCMMDKSN